MKLSQIFGKTLSSYDSWNGDHKVIKVESITITDDSKEIVFSGKGYYGNTLNVYVPINMVDMLMETKQIAISNTIDHCHVTKEIVIL